MSNTKTRVKISLFLVGSIILIIGFYYIYDNFMFRGIKAKYEWGIVQDLEYTNRERVNPAGVSFVDIGRYHLVCISEGVSAPKVWILLNPKYPPFVKMVPEKDYRITVNDLNMIRQKYRLNKYVEKELELHIIKNK